MNLGLGIAFVPLLACRGLLSKEVEFYSVGDYGRDICIYRRKNAYELEYVEGFYNMLVETFEQEGAKI